MKRIFGAKQGVDSVYVGMKYENKPINYKSIKEMPIADRPRERLHKVGARNIGDLELLCIILGSGGKNTPVQDVAEQILELVDRNGVNGVDLKDLSEISGLGPAKAAQISACLEFGRRHAFINRKVCNTPSAMFELVRHYGSRLQEHFICIRLNGAHEVMGVDVVSIGLVNRTLCHPREVFSEALKSRATAIVLAHNHPSGNLEPSVDDLEVTARLKKAGQILGIEVVDHIIFSEDDYHSLLESGEFIV